VLDVDGFKFVNDSLGHQAGDELIRTVARSLAGRLRASDAIARLGGDEFAVLLRGADADVADAVAGELIGTLRELALEAGEKTIRVTASGGIAALDDPTTAESVLAAADMAMYEAKRSGRDGYLQFTPDLDQRSRDRLILEMELRKAILAREFRVFYMPQVSLAGGLCRAVEALVRWEHPRRGLLAPAAFLELAEETGLLVQIDRIVLDEACRQLAEWRGRGLRMMVAVNVSPSEFQRSDFVDGVLSALERHNVEPTCLELELTESIAMASPARVAAIVTQLRAVGIRFALDDFGTGYSNLGHLTTLSFDTLKIDRSFTKALSEVERADAEMIIETILSLARNLGVITVAEGVETLDQVNWLRRNGCAVGQGYYFGAPMPAADFERSFLDQSLARAGAA